MDHLATHLPNDGTYLKFLTISCWGYSVTKKPLPVELGLEELREL